MKGTGSGQDGERDTWQFEDYGVNLVSSHTHWESYPPFPNLTYFLKFLEIVTIKSSSWHRFLETVGSQAVSLSGYELEKKCFYLDLLFTSSHLTIGYSTICIGTFVLHELVWDRIGAG